MIQWLTRDWGLKVIALVLAIGLWYYALGEEGIEVTRRVPLEISIENDQVSILKASTRTVKLSLVASRAQLNELASEKISAHHKIGNDADKAGEYSFRLQPSEIQLPSRQIRVMKIEPEIIQVTLDQLITQKLPVKVNFVGETAFGYQVSQEEIQLDPNAIMLEGPKTQLEKLDSVWTQKIDLVGRIRSFRRTVELDLPPNVKPLSEALIDLYVPIREEFEEKSFETVLVKALKHPDQGKIDVNPETVAVVLKGPKRKLADLTSASITAFADLSALENGEHEVRVEFNLPEDVSLKDDVPVTIQAKVKNKKLF